MRVVFLLFFLLPLRLSVHAEDLGKLSANSFNVHSIANRFGGGNPFSPNSVTNPFNPTVWR